MSFLTNQTIVNQELLISVLRTNDELLLSELMVTDEPTQDQRKAVMDLLTAEFSKTLDSDSAPSSKGVALDTLLGRFLTIWPIE